MSTVSSPPSSPALRALVSSIGSDTLAHASGIAAKALIFTLAAGLPVFRSSMVAINVGCALLLLAWAPLLSRRWRGPALLFLNLFLSTLLLADISYQRYFGSFVTAAVALFQTGQVGHIQSSASNLIHLLDLIWFLDLIVMGAWWVARRRGPAGVGPVPALPWMSRVRASIAMLLVGGLLVSLPVAQRIHRHGGRLYASMWSDVHFTDVNGILFFHAFDLFTFVRDQAFVGEPSAPELEVVGRVVRARTRERAAARTTPGDLFGVAKGANVITIQLEAIQAQVLGLKMGGDEVSPTLNRLADESLNFTRYYHQAAQGRTSDAELATLCSLHPLPAGSVFFRYPNVERSCVPRLLVERGYSATAYHAYFAGFWNRARAYPSLGIGEYVSSETLDPGPVIGLGLTDQDFYRQISGRILATQEPFMAHVISLTSHHPFTMPQSYLGLDTNVFEGTPFEHYLASVQYADAALGGLLESLDESGLLDRSVLVIYGDHDMGALAGADHAWEDLLSLDKSRPVDRLEIEKRIPMLIRLPSGRHGRVISGATGMVDLAPTLLHLLGIEDTPPEMLGRNRIREGEGLVAFRDGSVVTDDIFFQSGASGEVDDGACWEIPGGAPLPLERCEAPARQALDQLLVSDHVVRYGGRYTQDVAP